MADREIPPPSIIKQRIVTAFGMLYGLRVLVETGTYQGDMVEAQRPYFREIYSIELSRELHDAAKKRFDQPHIHLLQGDSGEMLGNIHLSEPTLFWLDGHYSGGITALGDKECPIFEELAHIKNSDLKHVVLIDDARLFTGGAYPTVPELESFIGAPLEVAADMIIWKK